MMRWPEAAEGLDVALRGVVRPHPRQRDATFGARLARGDSA